MAAPAALSGCLSFSYVDSDNVRHVIGLVDVAVKEADGASAVQVTGLGLSAFSAPGGGMGVALGYSRESFVSVPDGGCIDLAAADLCAKAVSDRQKEKP